MLHAFDTLPTIAPRADVPLSTTAAGDDYALVRRAIEYISLDYRAQPSLDAIAGVVGISPDELVRLFRRWAGLTPKAFLQAVTIDHARRLLSDGMPLLDAAMEVGLSGPSRLHDLFVRHEAVSPGSYKSRGAGIAMRYGFAASPFGRALVHWTERGVAGVSFCEEGEDGEAVALADMTRRWPMAEASRDDAAAGSHAARIFSPGAWRSDHPLRLVLIGSDFEVRVWEALLEIPVGEASTYARIASKIGAPKAARAVGAAVGRNPISFVVPCHRVVGSTGALTGYHWGLTRKRAMLGWEAGLLART